MTEEVRHWQEQTFLNPGDTIVVLAHGGPPWLGARAGRGRRGQKSLSMGLSASGEIPAKSFWHLHGVELGGGITAPGNSSVTLDESLGLILLILNQGRS